MKQKLQYIPNIETEKSKKTIDILTGIWYNKQHVNEGHVERCPSGLRS